MASKVQLTGGIFQDSLGNVLALGKLIMVLNQDGSVIGAGQIASGIEITINLNSSGSVTASPAQSVWGNDQILPINSYYKVTGYAANGQRAWGPNNQQVIGDGGTFDVGTWIPNTLVSWTPTLQSIELEVNGAPNTVQALLNLVDSATVTFTDEGDGSIHATAAAPATLEIQTEGVDNADQTLLNITAGNGVVVSNPSGGDVQISASTILSQLGSVHGFSAGTEVSAITGLSAGFNMFATGNFGPNNAGTATAPQSLSCIAGSNPGRNFFYESDGGATSTNYNSYGTFQEMKACVCPVGDVATSMNQWIGFYNGDVTVTGGLNTDLWIADPDHPFFGFRCFSGADTNWQCYVGTGAAETVVDSGVPVVSGTFVRFRIVKSGSSLLFYVNGVLKATITTNLPSSSTLFTPVMGCNNQDGIASNNDVRIAYFWWQNID